MAVKINLNIGSIPKYARIILVIVPVVLIAALSFFIFVKPKNTEIDKIRGEINVQLNEIAKSQTKSEKLEVLKAENERLKKRLEKLKEQLPEEKEISGLLRQISELSLKSGLQITSWKPGTKRTHPSGIVESMPVAIELIGSYHKLAYFFSSITRLNRIVNISNIKLGNPKPEKGEAVLGISFSAETFSAVPEGGKP